MSRTRIAGIAIFATYLACPAAWAQGETLVREVGLWGLFTQSFDFFTVVLLIGSISAVALIASCMLDVRRSKILPDKSIKRLNLLVKDDRLGELRTFTHKDGAFPSRVIAAALMQQSRGPDAMRESAELAASEECARWFRRIEPLNVIGNLGPLVGLAGTVWGMILAFSALSDAGGSAMVSELAPGISKALFHTLLGLCLAIPCLLVFGLYRSIIDRICTHAMVMSGDYVDEIIKNGSES